MPSNAGAMPRRHSRRSARTASGGPNRRPIAPSSRRRPSRACASPAGTPSTPTPTPGIPSGPPTAICTRLGLTGTSTGSTPSSGGKNATTGHAKIVGDDPLKLQVVEQGVYKSAPAPYDGRYPCGSLVYNGVWYYGTYCLHPAGNYAHDGTSYNWPWLGPFVGFRYSTDFGKTWTQTPCTPAKPLFGEAALEGRAGQDRLAALRRLRQEPRTLARRQGLPGGPRRGRRQPSPLRLQ